MSDVTSVVCPYCGADVGEWCFDWEAKYVFPPYEYKKIVRGGSLLTHVERKKIVSEGMK
jgi:hypothetical protein